MKNDYSKEGITGFLSRKYGGDIRLFPVREGQESQTYWLSHGGKEYVVRINSNMEGFKKDKCVYEHFRSDRVPIPEIVETNNLDGTYYFCINVKTDGITYEDSDGKTVVWLLGDITDVTKAIPGTNISGTSGCNVLDSDTGNAPFYSWREYLAKVLERDWTVVSRSYVNLSLIDELLAVYHELISYCPEERALLHGNFSPNNAIADKKSRVSGIIDWDCAAYEGFLYNIATMHFWRTWLICMEKTATYGEGKYSHLPRYTERTLRYELRIGLTEIYENAAENDTETIEWLQSRCHETLRGYRQRKAG